MAKANLTHHVEAAHKALSHNNPADRDPNEARKHLVTLENLGLETKDAEDALDTHVKLLKDDPDDHEAINSSWTEFTDTLLNIPATDVDVPDGEEAAPPTILPDGSLNKEEEAKVEAEIKAEKTPRVAKPKYETPDTHKDRLAKHVERFPTLEPLVAFQTDLRWDPKFFADSKFGAPPIPEGLSWCPFATLEGWTKDLPPGEFSTMAGYEFYNKLVEEIGLCMIYTANRGRIHQVEANPTKMGWITFYAGTTKRNATLGSLMRNCTFADLASTPIPDVSKPEPTPRAPRGSKGTAGPVVPAVPEGPAAEWVWNEETFTGVADDKFEVELTASGSHVFANFKFIGDGDKPEIADGKVRLKAQTRQKGVEEIQKRYSRGEFNG